VGKTAAIRKKSADSNNTKVNQIQIATQFQTSFFSVPSLVPFLARFSSSSISLIEFSFPSSPHPFFLASDSHLLFLASHSHPLFLASHSHPLFLAGVAVMGALPGR
jgi:hypothetical protein